MPCGRGRVSSTTPSTWKGTCCPTVAASDPLPPRTRLAVRAGGAVGALSRALRRGHGSVIGGRGILAVDSTALAGLTAGRTVALISGTNGKTTTTARLRAPLANHGPVAAKA